MKNKWRPLFAWLFIAFYAALGATVLGLMWLGEVTMSDASSVLVTMLAAGGGVTGVYTFGRTQEKREGVAGDFPPPDFPGGN